MTKRLINIITFLFIFSSFNREFVPFIDVRYLLMLLVVVALALNVLNFSLRHYVVFPVNKNTLLFVSLFFLLILVSNVKWFLNPYQPNVEELLNVVILYVQYFLLILAFALNWEKISPNVVKASFLISGAVLFASMIANFYELPLPFAGETRSVLAEEFAILGSRVGGYAEDQNYATFSMVLWLTGTFLFLKGKAIKILVSILGTVGILLSFSKTIIVAYLLALLLWIAKRLKILRLVLICGAVITVGAFWYLYDLLGVLQTMSTRFYMWTIGLESFIQNPFLGSGITSVRSNFEYMGNWYVQPHSTYIALLADHGIFAFLLYLLFFKRLYSIDNTPFFVLLTLFIFLSFTQELLVFPYPVFVLVLMPLLIYRFRMESYKITVVKI